MKKWLTLITILLLTNCNLDSFSDEIKQTKHHIISPDKKAILYQEEFNDNGKISISLTTLVNQKGNYGGNGILNIKVTKSINLKMKWLNDSLVRIKIPKKAIVLTNKKSAYFYGRKTYFEYIEEK